MVPDIGSPEAVPDVKDVIDLNKASARVLEVVREELVARRRHVPETNVEVGAMRFDPRYKLLGEDYCAGGDHSERVTALVANIRSRLKDSNASLASPMLGTARSADPVGSNHHPGSARERGLPMPT